MSGFVPLLSTPLNNTFVHSSIDQVSIICLVLFHCSVKPLNNTFVHSSIGQVCVIMNVNLGNDMYIP